MRRPWIGTMTLLLAAIGSSAGSAATASATLADAQPIAAANAPAAPPHGAISPATGARERNRPKVVEHYVDLNSASRKELMTLPGIGAAEALRIIAHRPYLTKTELVTKGVLQTGPFLTLRHQVVAMQKFQQNPRNGAGLAVARTQGSPANGTKSP